jgi:hypothetical protein
VLFDPSYLHSSAADSMPDWLISVF